MKALLIDIGALAMFFGYMAIVYWRGVSHEAPPVARRSKGSTCISSGEE